MKKEDVLDKTKKGDGLKEIKEKDLKDVKGGVTKEFCSCGFLQRADHRMNEHPGTETPTAE